MSVKEQLDTVLKTIEDAVQKHLEKEQLRIKNLSEDIFKSSSKVSQASEKNKILIEEITNATEELQRYNPMTIFEGLRKTAEVAAAASSPEQDDGFKEVLTDEEHMEAEKENAKAKAAAANAEANPGSQSELDEPEDADEGEDFKPALGTDREVNIRVRRANRSANKAKFKSEISGIGGGRTRRRRRHSFRRK